MLKSTRHVVTELYYHVVFVPKHRRADSSARIMERNSAQGQWPVLTGKVGALESIFAKIWDSKDIELIEAEIMDDHAHLFIGSQLRNAPSLGLNWLKDISARYYDDRHENRIRWARSYNIETTGSASGDTIEKYTREHHS